MQLFLVVGQDLIFFQGYRLPASEQPGSALPCSVSSTGLRMLAVWNSSDDGTHFQLASQIHLSGGQSLPCIIRAILKVPQRLLCSVADSCRCAKPTPT